MLPEIRTQATRVAHYKYINVLANRKDIWHAQIEKKGERNKGLAKSPVTLGAGVLGLTPAITLRKSYHRASRKKANDFNV